MKLEKLDFKWLISFFVFFFCVFFIHGLKVVVLKEVSVFSLVLVVFVVGVILQLLIVFVLKNYLKEVMIGFKFGLFYSFFSGFILKNSFWVMGFVFCFVYYWYCSDLISKKEKINPTSFEEFVAADLGISQVKHKKINLPKPLSFIGGFMSPFLLDSVYVNSSFKKKNVISDHEVIIHELTHVKIMKKWFIPYLLFISILLFVIDYFFNVFVMWFLFLFCVVLIQVLNEYVTFKLTKKYALSKGLPATRDFTKKHFYSYFVIYTVQIIVLFSIFYLVGLLV